MLPLMTASPPLDPHIRGRSLATIPPLNTITTHYSGPDATLGAKTYDWRSRKVAPTESTGTLALLEKGLLPLYRVFLMRYLERMQALGRLDLAEKAYDWGQALGLRLT